MRVPECGAVPQMFKAHAAHAAETFAGSGFSRRQWRGAGRCPRGSESSHDPRFCPYACYERIGFRNYADDNRRFHIDICFGADFRDLPRRISPTRLRNCGTPAFFAISIARSGRFSAIPRRFTCEGENLSPPLRWSDAPAETRSFGRSRDDWLNSIP
jgi:hypothetical protein